MKLFSSLLFALLLSFSAIAKDSDYTGSTPAASVIRTFLGIPMTDSIDFIRWKLTINDLKYKLQCSYGRGKPNTNGFYNGGKVIELSGDVKREKDIYHLFNKQNILKIADLNGDLLHFLDKDGKSLKGNGGWSYTINNLKPVHIDKISMTSKQTILKDSMAFEGRTPCGVPNVKKTDQCYKLKWYLVLYGDPVNNKPTTFRILGTSFRNEGVKRGTWKILTGKDGRTIYQLNDEKGNLLINFLKPDDNIILFTDDNGKLLVGDHDFSYTLNKRF